MTRRAALFLLVLALPGDAAAQVAQKPPMGFFVASIVPGSGNLGGLAGADQICQSLAAGVGAGSRAWHAYLSQEAREGVRAVNARDRIGNGPWYNAKGELIARNVAELHGDAERDRNNLYKGSALTEKGEIVFGRGDQPNQHDMLTGSTSTGMAFADGFDHTCRNWTSEAHDAHAMVGHSDRNGGGNTSWNSAHVTTGCAAEDLRATGGAGKFYCFAIN
jgi:hypothetical protein